MVEEVASGETVSIGSGETFDSSQYNNAGTITNAGTARTIPRDNLLQSSLADIDTISTSTTVVKHPSASIADTDLVSASSSRFRDVLFSTTDTDILTGITQRFRSVSATSVNIDTLTTLTERRVRPISQTQDTDILTSAPSRTQTLSAASIDSDVISVENTRKRLFTVSTTDTDTLTTSTNRVQVVFATPRDTGSLLGVVTLTLPGAISVNPATVIFLGDNAGTAQFTANDGRGSIPEANTANGTFDDNPEGVTFFKENATDIRIGTNE